MAESDDFASRVSKETPRRSLSLQFSPLLIIDGIFCRKSLPSYNKLPSEPLRLSVLKLDGSCFDIEVTKTATIAELKMAVEAVFSHMPQKGPGKISWPHVWGRFCLCYDGQKLVMEADYLKNYGIKDGDQLHFIRHVSNSCNLKKRQIKKRVVTSKLCRRLLSQVISNQQKERNNDDEDIGLDKTVIENGKIQHYNHYEDRVVNHENRLTGFLGGLFSYTRLAIVRTARNEGRISPIGIARGLLSSFRNIRRILYFRRKRHYSRRHAWCSGCRTASMAYLRSNDFTRSFSRALFSLMIDSAMSMWDNILWFVLMCDVWHDNATEYLRPAHNDVIGIVNESDLQMIIETGPLMFLQ